MFDWLLLTIQVSSTDTGKFDAKINYVDLDYGSAHTHWQDIVDFTRQGNLTVIGNIMPCYQFRGFDKMGVCLGLVGAIDLTEQDMIAFLHTVKKAASDLSARIHMVFSSPEVQKHFDWSEPQPSLEP